MELMKVILEFKRCGRSNKSGQKEPMKILNITRRDFGGNGIFMTQAINAYTRHESRNLTLKPHPFGYPTDIVTKERDEITKWLEWADVINAWVTFDAARRGKIPAGKILVLNYVGSYYYGDTAAPLRNEAGRKRGAHQFVAGAYMTRWGLPWLPFPIHVDRYERYADPAPGIPVVAQTASNPKRQSTDEISRVLGSRKDCKLKIITGVSHQEGLRWRGKAKICLGCFKGYGSSEAEAWSMHQPVISHPLSEKDEEAELKHIGYLPYYKATVEELPDVLDDFLSSPALYKEWADRGHEFVKKFHDAPVVAKRFTEFLEG